MTIEYPMKVSPLMNEIRIITPDDFSYSECLVYLNRSELECLHKIIDGAIVKLIKIKSQAYLIKIESLSDVEGLKVTLLEGEPMNHDIVGYIRDYVSDLFDLGADMDAFYALSKTDKIANWVIRKYRGLRIVKINDLFEGFCWSIIGQQINLKFAYTLKKRLVETYGESLQHNGQSFYLFPEPQVLSKLSVSDLKVLQFTGRKAEYVIGVASLFCEGVLNAETLRSMDDYMTLKEKLLSVRGVGNWTADYIMLKCLKINRAFPVADVGIHNALKNILGREQKPSITEIEEMAKAWTGHEAYMTFYLWRCLYD